MPSDRNEDLGERPNPSPGSEPEKSTQQPSPLQKRRNAVSNGLLLSGFLIAISFAAYIIPLAMYHTAQVAAAFRTRTALLLLSTVVSAILFLGVLLGLPFLTMAGLVGAFWAPLFAFGLHQRAGRFPFGFSALLFFLPVFGLVACVFFIPVVPDFLAFFEGKRAEFLANLMQQAAQTDPALQAKAVATWEETFQQFQQDGMFDVIARVSGFVPWQRLSWLVFGEGAPLFFGTILISLGNLVFLDLAFEQVEKFKAVVTYVLRNKESFARPLAEGLLGLPFIRAGRGIDFGGLDAVETETLPKNQSDSLDAASRKTQQTEQVEQVARPSVRPVVSVLSHERVMGEQASRAAKIDKGTGVGARGAAGKSSSTILRQVMRPVVQQNVMVLWGFRFVLDTQAGWNLKLFALPFWLALTAVAVMLGLGLSFSNTEGIVQAAAQGFWGGAIAWSGFGSFIILSVLAVQGMLVAYLRLTPLFLCLILLVFVLFGSYVSMNPHLVLAVFGSIGLLDYVHDLRGRLAKPQNAL